jgi:hypothetical protein
MRRITRLHPHDGVRQFRLDKAGATGAGKTPIHCLKQSSIWRFEPWQMSITQVT